MSPHVPSTLLQRLRQCHQPRAAGGPEDGDVLDGHGDTGHTDTRGTPGDTGAAAARCRTGLHPRALAPPPGLGSALNPQLRPPGSAPPSNRSSAPGTWLLPASRFGSTPPRFGSAPQSVHRSALCPPSLWGPGPCGTSLCPPSPYIPVRTSPSPCPPVHTAPASAFRGPPGGCGGLGGIRGDVRVGEGHVPVCAVALGGEGRGRGLRRRALRCAGRDRRTRERVRVSVSVCPSPRPMAAELDNMEQPNNNNGPWEPPEPPRGWDDPAATAKIFECSRIKALADERDAVQKKTFTKWVNAHLARAALRVGDLYCDLRDGFALTRLLELLSGEQLPKPTRGRMRIHSLENVDKALQFLKEQRVHLENVGSHDIVDGNHRLTLGLIWTIILRFQIQVIKIKTEDNRETRSAKDALLLWCQMKTAGYPEVNIQNFTTSWRDGLAFNALIHRHRPDLIDFHKLTKSNATYNLQQAFNTAEQQLGLSKLLDPEDVNMEDPDEKSIITYVVSFYHYFSKMKALAVEGKRIGKVLDQAMEVEAIAGRYEALAAELLAWIHHTVAVIATQKFANSLSGVQQQLQAFTAFCTLEKPVKFQEKGNLEVLLFTIQSKLRANNRKLYVPSEGKSISDINKAWTRLEKAEHEREAALRNELIRQEKLELLAQRFDHKVAMRETWLNENQRLVSQDNFGYDLPAVEAAMKKHEAIEADISSYHERIQVVVELAVEMESEGYYDTKRIGAQRDNVLRQWGLLTELLRARRARLEQHLALQKIFQEMVYMIDWMEEMQALLVSKEPGKHLLEAEDLLQKHGLLEADIAAQTERVRALNAAALRFSELEGYQPCDPQIIRNRVSHVRTCLEELGALARRRRGELEDSRQLWGFFQEMEEAEGWIREKEQILAAKTCGRDLSSVLALSAEHKSMLGELGNRRARLHQAAKRGEQLLATKRFSPGAIQERTREVRQRWKKLEEITGLHQQRLQEALGFFQFSAETDDLVAWLQDTYRLASSDDFGHDEHSTQALLRQHRALLEELDKHRAAVLALRKQLAQLAPEHRRGVDVQVRVVEVEQLYGEVAEVAVLRQQWLQDALAVYRMFGEVRACEVWLDEKEQWLQRMELPEELDEVEVVQHRFESLDQEMNSVMGRVLDVNHVVQQLLDGGHPSSEEVRSCQDHLNGRWNRVVELVEQKKTQLSSILKIQNYLLECGEMKAQVREKRKAIEATQSGGGDLGGVLALQRRLSTMEAALVVLEPRLLELQRQGEALAAAHPGRALEVLLPFEQISEEWEALTRALQGCEDSLSIAGRLQRFIQDLDTFLGWLVKTQAAVASEEVPETLADAERLLSHHAALKEEINGYEEDYAKIQAASELLALEETEVPSLSLQQWLQKLDAGWGKLLQSWETRREVLVQAHVFQLFLRDVQQCESSLDNQEAALLRAELPATLEGATSALRKHQDFTTTMELNLQKVQLVLQAGESLRRQGNRYGDRAAEAAERLRDKSDRNQRLAQERTQRLADELELQRFLQNCRELHAWVREQVLMAGDPSRDPPAPPRPWQRERLVLAELPQNREWLRRIEKEGEELLLAKPELGGAVRRQLEELRQCWAELEAASRARSRRLAEAAVAERLARSFADMEARLGRLEEQLESVGAPPDLRGIGRQLQRLQTMESQVEEWSKEVGELQAAAAALPAQAAGRQEVGDRQSAVGTRMVRLIEPLKERRRVLLAAKELHQVHHELEDEVLWVQERLPLATLKDLGTNLQTVQQLIKKNQSLRRELQARRSRVEELLERAGAAAAVCSPEAEAVQALRGRLGALWAELEALAERRQQDLDAAFRLHQFYGDLAEVEAWLGEQELLLMSDDTGKDEQSTLQLLKKHLLMEQTVENYEETIAQLSRQCRALLELGHPQSEQVSRRQSQVDRLYVSLKDLVEERKAKLEQQYWLYQLNREVDELEHWIAEKEVVATSPELGQDFEHVTVLQEKFLEFASETGSVGQERIAAVNQMVDELIDYGHADAATIAEWKDGVNEAWAELLELMETRAQMLAASHELHKFFNDCTEVLGQIEETRRRLPELAAREARGSAGALHRALGAFERDVELLVAQVRRLQEAAAQLRTLYAGDAAAAIAGREQEVLRAWKELLAACEQCRLHVASVADKIRFVGAARDLLAWMDGVLGQIGAAEKPSSAPPRDVSSVELLMSEHQSLKSEMDARAKSVAACLELGKSLLLSKSPAADEIKAHVDKLLAKKKEMTEKWDKHWEWLQQTLEVQQFAQEAGVAEAWLAAQEPLLRSRELGGSVDEVEQLLRRHEAFRRAAAAWDERFSALRRLTTIEKLKAEQNKQPPTPLLSRKFPGGEPPAPTPPSPSPSPAVTSPSPGATPPSPGAERHRVAYVRQELRPERLQPQLDRVAAPGEPPPKGTAGEPPAPPPAEEGTEGPAAAPERHRERRERRLERQESSEHEPPRHDGKGKATLADIVEQLQEKEAGGPAPDSVLGDPVLRAEQGGPGLLQGRQGAGGRGHPRRGAPPEPPGRHLRGGQRLPQEEERLQAPDQRRERVPPAGQGRGGHAGVAQGPGRQRPGARGAGPVAAGPPHHLLHGRGAPPAPQRPLPPEVTPQRPPQIWGPLHHFLGAPPLEFWGRSGRFGGVPWGGIGGFPPPPFLDPMGVSMWGWGRSWRGVTPSQITGVAPQKWVSSNTGCPPPISG
ncbi:spectrin beta chain, non-erythrocytic 4 isoform X2 [Patagioenas fasciata]|uniref:spectrin beta chain, non-erythrocytic 4 isoform X2 n=1 Tax=Patagioenas fasciata TaxID=372321 RepID=UPI003A99BF97